ACILSGTINFVAGGRNLPDPGAVIAVVPQKGQRPDEKAPVLGLRPDDPTPDDTNRGIAILHQIGGNYARADENGRFQIKVPNRGRYFVLVISREREARTSQDLTTGDLLKLSPFFDNAADLVGRQRYQLLARNVRSDEPLNVVFE